MSNARNGVLVLDDKKRSVLIGIVGRLLAKGLSPTLVSVMMMTNPDSVMVD
jgi:hypothetical protein